MLKYWLVLSLAALALARPETYKENEEFQYSRSSTDEGSKSGFYEAQRGNVGGNYEQAHNMDTVAQGQMSDAIDQVSSQVTDLADANNGDVYGAAYTSGRYGQSHFDRTNLEGRNFEERAGAHHDSAQFGFGQSQELQRENTNYDTASSFGHGYGSSHASGYQSASSVIGSSHNMEQAASDSSHYRIVPVKLSIRPLDEVNLGANVGISQHSYSQNLQDNRHKVNSLGHGSVYPKQTSVPNHYEKHHEYKYEKNWERHSEVTPVPLSIPSSNVEFVNNKEQFSNNYGQLHSEARKAENRQSVNLNNGYFSNSGVNEKGYESASRTGYQRVAEPVNNRYVVISPIPEYVISESKKGSQSSHQESEYSAGSRLENFNSYGGQSAHGHLRTSADNLSASSLRNHDALLTASRNGDNAVNGQPKKYHSAYSYHKSWERQGDPYIIQPPSDVRNVESERLQSYNHGYEKNSHYSNYRKQDDCEDEHHRKRRSPNEVNLVPAQIHVKLESLNSFHTHGALNHRNEYIPLAETKQEYETTTPESEDKTEQAETDFGNQYEIVQHVETPPDNEEVAPHYEDDTNPRHGEQLSENVSPLNRSKTYNNYNSRQQFHGSQIGATSIKSSSNFDHSHENNTEVETGQHTQEQAVIRKQVSPQGQTDGTQLKNDKTGYNDSSGAAGDHSLKLNTLKKVSNDYINITDSQNASLKQAQYKQYNYSKIQQNTFNNFHNVDINAKKLPNDDYLQNNNQNINVPKNVTNTQYKTEISFSIAKETFMDSNDEEDVSRGEIPIKIITEKSYKVQSSTISTNDPEKYSRHTLSSLNNKNHNGKKLRKSTKMRNKNVRIRGTQTANPMSFQHSTIISKTIRQYSNDGAKTDSHASEYDNLPDDKEEEHFENNQFEPDVENLFERSDYTNEIRKLKVAISKLNKTLIEQRKYILGKASTTSDKTESNDSIYLIEDGISSDPSLGVIPLQVKYIPYNKQIDNAGSIYKVPTKFHQPLQNVAGNIKGTNKLKSTPIIKPLQLKKIDTHFDVALKDQDTFWKHKKYRSHGSEEAAFLDHYKDTMEYTQDENKDQEYVDLDLELKPVNQGNKKKEVYIQVYPLTNAKLRNGEEENAHKNIDSFRQTDETRDIKYIFPVKYDKIKDSSKNIEINHTLENIVNKESTVTSRYKYKYRQQIEHKDFDTVEDGTMYSENRENEHIIKRHEKLKESLGNNEVKNSQAMYENYSSNKLVSPESPVLSEIMPLWDDKPEKMGFWKKTTNVISCWFVQC